MKRNSWATIMLLFSVMFIFACEHSRTIAPVAQQATLSNIQATIFSQKCGVPGCHVPGGTGPMSLQTLNESFTNLVNAASVEVNGLDRVTPSDPDNSYLVQKVEGAPGIVGVRMPKDGAQLSSNEIGLIRDWITAGALNN